MAGKGLTDVALRALKPQTADYKVADGGGLHMLVKTNGARLWRLAYRFEGKQKTLALGPYPGVGLAEARAGRDAAKGLLRDGLDPAAEKKIAKKRARPPEEMTFKAVAGRWFDARKDGWVETYSGRVWSRIEDDMLSQFGKVAVDRVTPDEVLAALRKMEDRGAVELAHRIKNHVRDIFEFAIAEGLRTDNPTLRLGKAMKKPLPGRKRKALPKKELSDFFVALAAYDGEELTRLALELLVHTFVRTQELRFAAVTEFEGLDGAEPVWRIPPERMKMRNPHIVPLSPQAVRVVRRLLEIRGKRSAPELFPAATNSGVISENTMLYAMYRMGFHGRGTPHGFRSTASTVLNEAGYNRDWIERQLAHVEQDQVRAAYNAAEWLPERRAMMCWWSDFLDREAEAGALIG